MESDGAPVRSSDAVPYLNIDVFSCDPPTKLISLGFLFLTASNTPVPESVSSTYVPSYVSIVPLAVVEPPWSISEIVCPPEALKVPSGFRRVLPAPYRPVARSVEPLTPWLAK